MTEQAGVYMNIDGKLRSLYLIGILKEPTRENHKLLQRSTVRCYEDKYEIDMFRTIIRNG